MTKNGQTSFDIIPFLCSTRKKGLIYLFLLIGACGFAMPMFAHEEEAILHNYTAAPNAPAFQTWDDAGKKSAGCVSCHTKSDRKTMHANEAVVLGCTDCHGGDANIFAPSGQTYSADDHHDASDWSGEYRATMDKAHVLPRFPEHWNTSANPE